MIPQQYQTLPRQGQDICERIQQNRYDCLICTENIKNEDEIWCCKVCYTIIHFNCISHWASNKTNWLCPVCRSEFNKQPKKSCYCGKSLNGSKFDFPHSCGNICGKKRANCPHPCTLKCHPGPCPPCLLQGKLIKCHCGKETKQLKCGETEETFSCGKPCGKTLKCKHQCNCICHSGDCPPCEFKKQVRCYCGRHTNEMISCKDIRFDKKTKGHYSCGEICGVKLSCGNHFCNKKCHTGQHSKCPYPITLTTCPCGKTEIEPRSKCTDPVPCCRNMCDKPLPCGHTCRKKCHMGECPECSVQVTQECRCGNKKRVVPCSESKKEFECDLVCGELLSCGIHRCERICCPAKNKKDDYGIHHCKNTCGKLLSCGKHKCELQCHKGRCGPCRNVLNTPLTCRCGKTVINPPVVCGTLPPLCSFDCTLERPCGHKSITHKCHFGPCPRCTELVDKKCFCGKEILKNIPCYLNGKSCGNKCNKLMPCGVHRCQKICHDGPCSEDGKCGYLCGKKHSYCQHSCIEPCHGDTPCPTEPCKQIAENKCKCGTKKVEVVCNATPENPFKPTVLSCNLACFQKELEGKELKAFKNERVIKYPLWFLSIILSNLSLAKKYENQLKEFTESREETVQFTSPNEITTLMLFMICNAFNVPVNQNKINKKLVFIGTRLKHPDIPNVLPTVAAQNSKIKIDNKESPATVNVIIYDNSRGETSFMLNICRIKDTHHSIIENAVRRLKYSAKINEINQQNIVLHFDDEETIETVLQTFVKLGCIVIRDDMRLEEEEEVEPYQDEFGFTGRGVTEIYHCLLDRLRGDYHSADMIMWAADIYYDVLCLQYTQKWNVFLEREENNPVLDWKNEQQEGFIIKAYKIVIEIKKLQINKTIGVHPEIDQLQFTIKFGGFNDAIVIENPKYKLNKESQILRLEIDIDSPKTLQKVIRKKMGLWIKVNKPEVIGKISYLGTAVYARYLPYN